MPVWFSQFNGAQNSTNTFSITTPPLNQRMESYFSKLRQDFSRNIVDMGLYNPVIKSRMGA